MALADTGFLTGFALPDRAIATLLGRLTAGGRLGVTSLILFGGLTRGEWAEATSDIDLVCLLEREVDGETRAALDALYDRLEAEDPQAFGPLYVYHMPLESLKHPQFRLTGGPTGLRVGNTNAGSSVVFR